ncbi:MAG: hypothetical protein M3308_09365 [Actinomycetota bacterium]|nr:hypothetical protein [Actinomycetota bacterium]
MTMVIDTAVTMAWCFEDESTPETEAVLDRLGDGEAPRNRHLRGGRFRS